jgi:hypothetical protein
VNILTGTESNELFGGPVPAAVLRLLEQARQQPREHVAATLWSAALGSPHSLPAYYLLYKLHTGLGELDSARQAALMGLDAAARAAALQSHWTQVQPTDADFDQPGPARFWLFTLKALAFIELRRGQPEAVRPLLAQLQRLDPHDRLGGSVIARMLEASSSSLAAAGQACALNDAPPPASPNKP